MATVTQKKAPALDSRTRAFFRRLLKPFQGFTGTPLREVYHLMEGRVHSLESAILHLDLACDFKSQNLHLEKVPYTKEELKWAVKNGFVLTPFISSARRINRKAPGDINLPHALAGSCPDIGRSPRRPQWWLVQRDPIPFTEMKSLGATTRERNRRLATATVGIALSQMYLDYCIYGLLPKERRLTASQASLTDGNALRLVVVGPGAFSGSHKPIEVSVARGESMYRPVTVLKPHHIFHPEA